MKIMFQFILVGLSLATSVTGSAEPTIRIQPSSLAVLLGTNATFRVTAGGTAPLTYQWRFEDRDLVSATNSKLVVSNVTLADFGRYTVVVRDPSGEAVSRPACLKLARWTQLVAFGASACLAEFSNGPSWVDYLAELLCIPANQKKNYAEGGVGTSGVRSQIGRYLSANTPGANTLLAPWWAGAGYDLATGRSVTQVVSDYTMNIRLLAQAGGRAFILPTVAQLYLVPKLSGDTYLRSIDYQHLNARMSQEIQTLQTDFGLTIYRYDLYDLGLRVWANPMSYGFTNLTNEARNCDGCDPTRYFWWDEHFTTATHRLIAQEMYRGLTPPAVITLGTDSASGGLELQWQGGSPPFLVQRCEDLVSGLWRSEDLTLERRATRLVMTTQEFFRILDLGQ